MPTYVWQCEACAAFVEVWRDSTNDHAKAPRPEEALCEFDDADREAGGTRCVWTRVFEAPSVARGPNWRGRKGCW